MTSITLNGENKQIENNSTVDTLLKLLDLEGKRLAVEINQEIIPHSSYSTYELKESDRVEIVQAIGGG